MRSAGNKIHEGGRRGASLVAGADVKLGMTTPVGGESLEGGHTVLKWGRLRASQLFPPVAQIRRGFEETKWPAWRRKACF